MKLLTITIAAVALSACAVAPLTPSVEIESPSQVDVAEADVPSGTEPPVTPTTLVPPSTVVEINDEFCYPLVADGVGGCVDPPAGGTPWQEPGLSDESCWPQVSDGTNCVDQPAGGTPATD